MTSLKIDNQTYDLVKQEFRSNGNGSSNGRYYDHVQDHDHDHAAQWLDDDFITAEDTQVRDGRRRASDPGIDWRGP
jgi:hypothetical protein